MALRFHERESGIDKYSTVDPASWAPCVSDFSDPTTAGLSSSCSTPTTNGDVLRRGAATDLMEQVGDALAAPRSAYVHVRRHTCSPVTRHPTIDASDTGASRAWGPRAHIGQPAPKTPSEASDEARNESEECLDNTMAGRSRALFVTKRHKTSRLAIFASHFRDRAHLLKMPLGVRLRLKSTRPNYPRVCPTPNQPQAGHKNRRSGLWIFR